LNRKTALLASAIVAIAGTTLLWYQGNRIEFLVGGAMVNIGYRLQDRIHDYDFEHHDVTPQQVWDELLDQNRLASSVRARFPRSNHHPLVAMVTCMDARLDTNEVAGDTRRYYYVLRLAGSVMSPKEEDMLELAVNNGTKVVVFTTHSDCAAEKVAKDPAQRDKYPHLSHALSERKARLQAFMDRETIRQRTTDGSLLVKWMHLDTDTERIEPIENAHVLPGR
jgi:carbonic anhydrase